MRHSVRAKNLAAIERAIAAIHAAPAANNSIVYLAEKAGLSPRRFHSLFGKMLGETVGSYVRRTRLEYAVSLMRLHPPLPLTDIALRAGYSELSDFSRRFQKHFGRPPSQWDRAEPLNSGKNCQASEREHKYLWHEFPPRPQKKHAHVNITTFQPMRLAVLNIPSAHKKDNLKSGFDSLEKWVTAADQFDSEKSFLGLGYHDLFSTKPDLIDFGLAYPVSESTRGDDTVFIRIISRFMAAVIHTEGGLVEFASDWDSLIRGWLPDSGYRRAHLPTMEIYYNDPRPSDMSHWDMDCVLPLTPLEL